MSILFSLKNSICYQNSMLRIFHRKHLLLNLNKNLTTQLSQQQNQKVVSFDDNVKQRRDEANRSILVQVQSAHSFHELQSYCSSVGTVKKMMHYSTGVEPMHFIIVEFAKASDLQNIYTMSSYIEDTQVVPVQSSYLWFRAATKKLSKNKNKSIHKLNVENGNHILRDNELLQVLNSCADVNEQMVNLHNSTRLNEVGTRLRFLVAKQIEMAISGMFPNSAALPFGSSVNGFGKMGCDLDLVLRLNDESKVITDETRLVYHCKALSGSERSISQRHMEVIGDILQLFLPGCSQVRKILQARVPIIKYYQQLTDVECDLSMSNTSGYHMSDFLYIMGAMDHRVRPLIFTIRRWAATVGLTNSSPGRWITNFSLTLLVIGFLQNLPKPVLPSLNALVKLAGKNDKYITDDGINCTFLRDINVYLATNPIENTDSLKILLLQFFVYYSQFDFSSKAICLNESMAIAKPEHSALYIVNPLERGLNVSKNVSPEELEKFRLEVRNAAWLLESDETKDSNWGIIPLLTAKRILSMNNGNLPRTKLLEVSKLFEDDKDGPVYKNNDVKKQVQNIRKDTKKQLENTLNVNQQKSGR
ncbi:PREDICTED: poly(A) RNA polymerase, mitochondrial isoform X2 [Nicrophorus vespilloides]|uniref:Poly(A) RNA polymerase, mitochondrial isoform X2 n=1 Tax=Nicrophorus vespilloides TaxID=110193 RepID=A0ABM1MQ83_NICVS|nr:PREDICTED: poly(A) RNA polymerase, mitochondrial isoform X2 [Nicrophorus vespilloides]